MACLPIQGKRKSVASIIGRGRPVAAPLILERIFPDDRLISLAAARRGA